jgi:predicted DNA-binding transcriptional regulator AlpA
MCGEQRIVVRTMFNNASRGANMVNSILRLPDVKARTGLSRSTIYLRISNDDFPGEVKIPPSICNFTSNPDIYDRTFFAEIDCL